MEPSKTLRWKQRFENFEKAFLVLDKYAHEPLQTELERAGLIQLFEVTFELAWKVLKDFEESVGYEVKSPREAIKTAVQMELVENGHVWMDALADRTLSTHTYEDTMAEKLAQEIRDVYHPEIEKLYARLLKER